ncbi:MAG: hypothetical protein P4M08_02895 [Oligoflexia bacterium]|nr:hypothetical protein [Oligoflexia bacterium]
MQNQGPILITAAMGFEARPILKGIAKAPKGSFELLRSGIGNRAALALLTRLQDHSLPTPSLVISSGLAGIELRGVPIGTWVVGTEIQNSLKTPPQPVLSKELEQWLKKAKMPFISASYRSAAEVVQVSHSQGLGAVDMESAALARVCRERNIPFAILRLVSDNPDAPLPHAIGAFVRVSTESTLIGKAQGAVEGLKLTFNQPKDLGRFLLQSVGLSKKLTEGWRKLTETEFSQL